MFSVKLRSSKRRNPSTELSQALDDIEDNINKMAAAKKQTDLAESMDSEGERSLCGHCKVFVEDGIECGDCQTWFHCDKECSRLENAENVDIKSDHIFYICHRCIDSNVSENTWARQSCKKINKLSANMNEMQEFMKNQLNSFMMLFSEEFDNMRKELNELKEKLAGYEEGKDVKVTYASKLKSKNTLVIKSTESTTKAADNKLAIMSKISSNVEQVKTSKQGHLVVNFADNDKLEKAKCELDVAADDMNVSVDKKDKLWPKIMVSDIDQCEEDIIQSILKKNEGIRKLVKEEDDFKLIKEMKSKHESKTHVIIKCSPAIRGEIYSKNDRVYTTCGGCCRVYDSYKTYQCYKCQEFGHSANRCTKTEICARCGQGHRTRSCNVNTANCHNCTSKGLSDTNHRAYDSKCPVYAEEIARIKNRTEHGF